MKRFVFLTCIIAAAGWLVTGCHKSPPPFAKKKSTSSRTNYVENVPTHKPKPKPVKEVRLGTSDYLDAQNGFRDATFGQSEANFTNLVEVTHDDDRQLKTCIRSDEILSFHDVPLEHVNYRFYRGELYAIEMAWKVPFPDSELNRPSTTGLATYLTSDFGPPRRRRVTKEGVEYFWRGHRVQIAFTESLLPGVTDIAKGGWGIPPTTLGRMVVKNLPLSRAAEGGPVIK